MPFFIADFRYQEQLKTATNDFEVALGQKSLFADLQQLPALGSSEKIGFAVNQFTFARYRGLLTEIDGCPSEKLVAGFGGVKNEIA